MTTGTPASGSAVLSILDNGTAVVSLGGSDEAVITLTAQRIKSLREIFGRLRASPPKGLVITGPSLEMFTVGADINVILSVSDPKIGELLAKEGQEVFSVLEAIPCIKVAAISGPCVGGGCELVLACDYRIMADTKGSIIGLPETKLGILPGFGGTQRLPRLVGLASALDIIIAGKTLNPSKALRAGIVNEVVSAAALRDRAIQIASGKAKMKARKLSLADKITTHTSLGRYFVKKKASASIAKKSHGFYPALPAALKSCVYGLANGTKAGYQYEAEELGKLIVTSECKNLVKLYFLTEAAKGLGKSGRKALEGFYGLVVGAGVMGAGIAASIAKAGYNVILQDINQEAVNRGYSQIERIFSRLSEKEREEVLGRIEKSVGESPNIGKANFVVEAILEEIGLKQKVLGGLAQKMQPGSLICTNTSSLSVTTIAEKLTNQENVAGFHFFNPVEKMPLVEVVRGKNTSDKALSILCALTTKMGKFPIVVGDCAGFLINRILSPYMNEAAYLVAEGYNVQEIDKVVLRFGMPMGPVRLLDEVGLDIIVHVQESMKQAYGERMSSPDLAGKLVKAGRKGKKSGGGFYDFSDGEAVPFSQLSTLLELKQSKSVASDSALILDRLMLALVNEAVKCLDEGIAGTPGPDAAGQINLGTVMGMGFPPFRGGVLNYADSRGAKEILKALEQLERTYGARFAPAEGIRKRAEKGLMFNQSC